MGIMVYVPYAMLVWNRLTIYCFYVISLGLFGLSVYNGGDVRGSPLLPFLTLWWDGFPNSFKDAEKACWEAIFFAIIWSLWKARNELIFFNVNIVKAELVDVIKLRITF